MTAPAVPCLLVVNSGSSSIKFAAYRASAAPELLWQGRIERVGQAGTALVFGTQIEELGTLDRVAAVEWLALWLEARPDLGPLQAVGHRIVFGGPDSEVAEDIDDNLLADLRRLAVFAPEHLPAEIETIEALRSTLPGVRHIACFDTSFHHDLPAVARLLPLPRAVLDKAVRRYGFHGLSYTYLMAELGRIAPAAAAGRVVLAHLGNGASLAAVAAGRCIDTTMACTPAAGIPMGSRSGDLDPGLARVLAATMNMDTVAFDRMVQHESGLLGLSGRSADMRDLLALEADEVHVAEAVALFCYSVRKAIGAYAAALGGLDALVFAGGIGEHAGVVRARICADLAFLGVELDAVANDRNAGRIGRGRVPVFVIPTDEQIVIARAVMALLGAAAEPST